MGMAIRTAISVAVTTWTRVSIDNSQKPMSPISATADMPKKASRHPFTCHIAHPVTKMRTGHATEPVRKSRIGTMIPATMKSLMGRVSHERLSLAQTTT
jgi:hypothetical protein